MSEQAGVSDPRTYFGLGVAWFDFNDDGWPDLYVANDSTPNFLYLNQKDGTFKEIGFPAGVAVSEDGAEQGSMGVAVGDYDNSGRFSLFVTNFAEEYNNAVPQRRRSLHRRVVPLEDSGRQPALRRLGDRASSTTTTTACSTSSRSTDTCTRSSTRHGCGARPAIVSGSCCTGTMATARSTRSRRSTARR